MNVKPTLDRVLIKPLEEAQKGKIIVPENAKEKSQQGEVLAAGRGRPNVDGDLIANELKPGDKVIFRKYAGDELTVDEDKCLLMLETDVLAVME